MDRPPASTTPRISGLAIEATVSERRATSGGDSLLSGVSEDFGFGGQPEPNDPWLGHEVGGARLVRLVGLGGMGRVYEAVEFNPNRRVAVKLARAESLTTAATRRLCREADVLATLEHPCIARIYAAGSHPVGDGRALPFIVIEFVADARPITEWCRDRALDERSRLGLLLVICDAVSHAHDRGVVHRDLKPGNVLVDGDGRPRLVDFGIASWVAPAAPTLSVGDRIAGTPAYMSPEQREGSEADARSDVYALGVLAAELLTGESPARAQVSLAGRRDRVARIVKRCLEIDADDRYGSVREFATALRSQLHRLAQREPRRLPTVRMRVWVFVLALEAIVIAAMVVRDRFRPPISHPVFGVEKSPPTETVDPPAT